MKRKGFSNNREKEQWVQEALASLDGIKRAECKPFLYTRVMARIENRYGLWEKIANFVAKPAFAIGSVILFIGINVSVLLWGNDKKEEILAVKSASEQMLAAEFTNIQPYTLVEINVEK